MPLVLFQGYVLNQQETNTEGTVVVGHEWPNDSERSARANVAKGTDSNGGQVEGDDEEQTRYSGPSGWGLKREANDLTSLKKSLLRSLIIAA